MEGMNRSYVIAVLGGKGGVGKSTISTNLAISFLLDTKRPVLLIDADPDTCGDQGIILGLKSRRTVSDVAKFTSKITPAILKEFLASHSTGLSYIPFVDKISEYASVSPVDVKRVLEAAMENFNYTVVDCGSRLTDQVVAILETATIILVVTNPEILVLKHSKRLIDDLNGMLFHPDIIKVIVNKYDPSSPITPEIVQANLGIKILGAVNDDAETCMSSLTKGKPAIISAPKSLVARNIYHIARVLQERGILDSIRS
jgi:MinD-like ATPase involved in chromosome partitioning or flagellar assembly